MVAPLLRTNFRKPNDKGWACAGAFAGQSWSSPNYVGEGRPRGNVPVGQVTGARRACTRCNVTGLMSYDSASFQANDSPQMAQR